MLEKRFLLDLDFDLYPDFEFHDVGFDLHDLKLAVSAKMRASVTLTLAILVVACRESVSSSTVTLTYMAVLFLLSKW